MAKKKNKKKDVTDNVWEEFAKTGAVGVYLLYRNIKGD
jgi:hypothetical protein